MDISSDAPVQGALLKQAAEPSTIPSQGAGARPPVEAYDPYFRRLFEHSESFFRRCEAMEPPRTGED